MSAVARPRAKSLSPRLKRAALLTRRDKDLPLPGLSASTSTNHATAATAQPAALDVSISKKQKVTNGSAVAVKMEPTSTPRKPLCTNGADGVDLPPVAGPSGTSVKPTLTLVASSRKDKEARLQSLKQDAEQDFVAKYTRAFPNFVFHFDNVEPGNFGVQAKALGARIDKFFSRSVTHVVTSRPIPILKDKENAPPSTTAAAASRRVTIGGTDGRTATSKSSKMMLNPFLDETGQSDVLLKAQAFNMKVWDFKKFQSVINRLLPPEVSPRRARIQSRAKVGHAEEAAATLSHLLEDERRHGTRERDQNALRPDWQYFTRGSYFALIEDATGEFRTVIAKEYERPAKGDYPEWPVIHESFLKPSVSKFAPPTPPPAAPAPKESGPSSRSRPIARLPSRLLKGVAEAPDLRRSVSLNNLGRASKLAATIDDLRRPAAADHDGPYIAASGNSVNVTSNTTSAQSGAAGNTFDRQGQEKALAELNRRAVAFQQGPRPSTTHLYASAGPVDSGGPAVPSGSARAVVHEPSSVRKRKTRAAMAAMVQAEREKEEEAARIALEAKVMADHVHRELKGTGKMDPPPMKKRHSLPADLKTQKEKVRLPPREETKKPGYCENCRNKFEDFGEHIQSRRHRRFALNDKNFDDLDKVLGRLGRHRVGRTPLCWDPLGLNEPTHEEDYYGEEEASQSASSEEPEEESEEEEEEEVEEEEDELLDDENVKNEPLSDRSIASDEEMCDEDVARELAQMDVGRIFTDAGEHSLWLLARKDVTVDRTVIHLLVDLYVRDRPRHSPSRQKQLDVVFKNLIIQSEREELRRDKIERFGPTGQLEPSYVDVELRTKLEDARTREQQPR